MKSSSALRSHAAACAALLLLSCRRPAAAPAAGAPASPPASTTTPAAAPPAAAGPKVGTLLAGPLEPERLKAFLFGGGEVAASTVEVGEPLAFTEKGSRRAYVVTTENASGIDCHSCAPLVGAAAFTQTPAGWRLDAVNLQVDEIGANGEAPSGELVALGAERHGLLFRPAFSNMGETASGLVLFAERGGTFADVLQASQFDWENTGDCGEDADAKPCASYESTLEFVPSGGEMFDLKVTTRGSRVNDERKAEEFSETTVYRFDGTKYVKRS